MGLVKFTSVEEFLEELEKERGNIERRIVRVTNLYTQSKIAASIKHVQVVATFIVCAFPAALPTAGPHIVKLERYCGDIWGFEKEDQPTLKRAKEVNERIEAAAEKLGIEVRAGIWEE